MSFIFCVIEKVGGLFVNIDLMHTNQQDSLSIQIIPRQKKKACGNKQMFLHPSPVVITHELIKTLHGLSLPQAAQVVGISSTAFKRVCRRLGIDRWEFKRGKAKCWMGERLEESTDIEPSDWADGDYSIEYSEDARMNMSSIDNDLGSLMLVGLTTQPQGSQTDLDWEEELAPQPLTEADDSLILELLAKGYWRSDDTQNKKKF